jgi:hypothetical protein
MYYNTPANIQQKNFFPKFWKEVFKKKETRTGKKTKRNYVQKPGGCSFLNY